MHTPSLIQKKRDGDALSEEEIRWMIRAFTDGAIPEYQMSAFAMAVFFQGMTPEESAALTSAMMHSGVIMDYPEGTPPKVDKHSTGGIGDKVSLILAPLLACDELWVPMISGRGLGITGGTLDKLESIPGFNVNLDRPAMLRQLEKIGVVMVGQTADLCPADKKLYALRDVTATVESRPLIVASIMCKKLAESLDRLVLDVKFGSGAFMKTRADAELLANELKAAAASLPVEVSSRLTLMEEPLGCAVGNALEVAEAVACLQGGGPPDLRDLTLDLCEAVSTVNRHQLARWLDDGTAWQRFVAMTEAQGGDATALESLATRVHAAPVIRPLPSPDNGTVTKMDAGTIGLASLQLGAGRKSSADAIDYAVGISSIRKTGCTVTSGEPLLQVHARSESDADAAIQALASAIDIR